MGQERTSKQVELEPGTHSALVSRDHSNSRQAQDPSPWRPLDQSEHPPDLSVPPRKEQIIAHLDLICKSPSFASTKRCQQFLRYIVLETLAGRGEMIKERNIANEVFSKGVEFEPGEDSVVRVKAREVRKRLSDFYELFPPDGLQIELPLGGYTPRIFCPSPTEKRDESDLSKTAQPNHAVSRRMLLWMLGGAAGVAGTASVWQILERRVTPLDRLWKPVFATKTPLVIFIPMLKDKISGAISDRVGIGPLVAIRHAADFLGEHHYPYHLRLGADLTFAQLREQPSLLLGGFTSIWTQLMIRNLRFSYIWNTDSSKQAIVDTQTKQIWRPLNITPEGYADQDYGILCRLFDKVSGQIVMIAGGITTFATEGAASVFFNQGKFRELIKHAPQDWEGKNIEAVVRVSIIGSTPSSPQIIATHFW